MEPAEEAAVLEALAIKRLKRLVFWDCVVAVVTLPLSVFAVTRCAYGMALFLAWSCGAMVAFAVANLNDICRVKLKRLIMDKRDLG